jgi:hypothetical protein
MTSTAVFKPHSFFVAWNGVMTLAFDGFPQCFVEFKQHVTEHFQLKTENFGSKWPKITLGAFRDEDTTLSLEQLTLLHGMCVEFSKKFNESLHGFCPSSASIVAFRSRSLEHLLSRTDITIPSMTTEAASVQAKQAQLTSEVLSEFDEKNIEKYLEFVNRPGNREQHYRVPHTETTLVCFASTHKSPETSTIVFPYDIIASFQSAIDEQLPNVYEWFNPSSMHVTLRALQ